MNRTEAKKHIGHTVIVDKGKEGVYYGRLEEVNTPPRKIWTGKVHIQGVVHVPHIDAVDSLQEIKHTDQIVSGSQIHATDHFLEDLTYEESVLRAIETKIQHLYDQTMDEIEEAEEWLKISMQYGTLASPFQELTLQSMTEKREEIEEPYTYYRLLSDDDIVFLLEPRSGETLVLEGCPFEFEVYHKDKGWVSVHYKNDLQFIDKKGKTYELELNDWVRIHQKQFEPFTMMLNELEVPAKKSLLYELKKFGFDPSHVVYCHNRLLLELLAAEGTTTFRGVNFITLQNQTETLHVQHHYERILYPKREDYVYDRFECTTDTGKRSIATYTNSYTKDKKQ
ncbi:DUF2777 family protein [Aliibacillus thermotolerans]|uniref:DUF2777 family protein n=1 Tax=Aliibacillus thermotolerans TaxID=1834418 RepID=A0ABW0U6A5_9BACI|nr:DUF2777 family protein [Aliibacillus thermotolerans]MDA3130141.1 DUF2777 family protein [Aliibacillus thermotolerans]